jgi:hypothetical protein
MKTASLLIAGLIAAPASAAGTISITIPRLSVAEYHRPYLAAWVEPAGGGAPQTLLVWYDVKKAGAEPGTKWLADMRTWWRKAGRTLKIPADGVSGATRNAGTHQIPLPDSLKPGAYTLFVESAREAGGREVVSVPLSIPVRTASASGKTELGAIAISAR